MAKKSSRVSPQLLRIGDIKTVDARKYADECLTHITNLRMYITSAEKARVPTISMDGYTKLKKATGELQKFTKHFFIGLSVAKENLASSKKNAETDSGDDETKARIPVTGSD